MTKQKSQRVPHAGKLVVAIAENLVKPVLGQAGIEEIKAPLVEKQLRQSLKEALAHTEGRFTAEHTDVEMREALLTLSLADLPTLQEAVWAFCTRPTDPTLSQVLRDQLRADFSTISAERIETAVAAFLDLLRQELAACVPQMREKLNALAHQHTARDTARTAEAAERTADAIEQLLARLGQPGEKQPQPQPTPSIPPHPHTPSPHPASPITPSHPPGRISAPQQFFGRARLLREIRTELEKRCSVSLVGESQIGKSSLLYYLYQTRADWLPDVATEYVDLQGVLDEADFCETVLTKLGQSGNTLRDLKRALAGCELILLLDEVERIAEPDFNPRLHDLLRSLSQEQHFAICLATRRPLVEVFPARAPGGVSPFHNVFAVKTLGPFSPAEARAFLAQRLAPTGVTFTEGEIERLLAQSNCRPARLQKLAGNLFEEKTR